MTKKQANTTIPQDSELQEELLKPVIQASPVKMIDKRDGSTRFRIQFDVNYKGHPGKTPVGESETVPDMTLTLGTLLERHSRGQNVPTKEPIYFETEVPTFNDFTDVERYSEQLERRSKEVKEFIKNELEASKKAEKEAKKASEAKQKGRQLDLEEESKKASPSND